MVTVAADVVDDEGADVSSVGVDSVVAVSCGPGSSLELFSWVTRSTATTAMTTTASRIQSQAGLRGG